MWHLQKIPQIVHFYWGNDFFSYLRYLSLESFIRFNPEWKVALYVPKQRSRAASWVTNEHKIPVKGENYFDAIKKLPVEIIEIDFFKFGFKEDIPEVHKSDFLRWFLLGSIGGMWNDSDILYFRPIDDLYFNISEYNNLDTVVCFLESIKKHSIGFLMSSPNNPYFSFINKQVLKQYNPKDYQTLGASFLNEQFPSIESIRKRFPTLTVLNLPMDIVYSYGIERMPLIYESNPNSKELEFLTDKSIGLHWYAGYPEAQKFENEFTPNTFPYLINTVSFCAGLSQKMYMHYLLARLATTSSSILDMGCGDKAYARNLPFRERVVTLDIVSKYQPDVLHDLSIFPYPFKNNSFDLIYSFDVIEHLDKDTGFKFLEELKRITKKTILIFTPKFWTLNEVKDIQNFYYGNTYNLHKSLWTLDDFKGWKQVCNHGWLKNYLLMRWDKR
jgi:predicted SAM-dependent methyltransferase